MAQAWLVALWEWIIPSLLAALVVRCCIPPALPSSWGGLGALARGHAFWLGAALFVGLAALARHWRFRCPGGRYASALPAHLVPDEASAERLEAWASLAARYTHLAGGSARRRLERTVSSAALARLDEDLEQLREALGSGDLGQATANWARIKPAAAPALAWRLRREALGMLLLAATATLAVLSLRRSVEQYAVVGVSMLPTLEEGDRLAGNRRALGAQPGGLPRRGDIVLFRSWAVHPRTASALPETIVKRVFGLPGDRIEMRGDTAVINGWPVPACDAGDYVYVLPDGSGRALAARLRVEYLDDRAFLTVYGLPRSTSEPYVVKDGEVYVLGDNRGDSLDSRSYADGAAAGVPVSAMEARADWFLFGTHRDGSLDVNRLGERLEALQVRPRLEGIDASSLEATVLRCLRNPPPQTRPPPPAEPRASQDSRR